MEIIAARSLIQLANHFKGTQVVTRPVPPGVVVAGVPARVGLDRLAS